MTEKIYLAPCKSYQGHTIVRKLGLTTDTRGQEMIMVQAIKGTPWSDWSSGGFVMTSRAKFYPENIISINQEKEN